MKKSLLIVLCAGFIVVMWVWCDYSYFSSRPSIEALSHSIPDSERSLPENVRNIFVKLDITRTDVTATRRLLMTCRNIQGMSNLELRLHELTWRQLVPHTLNKTEELAIYAHLMPFAKGQGVAYGAQTYFSKDVSELTDDQILTLLVISKSPYRFLTIDGNQELKDGLQKMKELLK